MTTLQSPDPRQSQHFPDCLPTPLVTPVNLKINTLLHYRHIPFSYSEHCTIHTIFIYHCLQRSISSYIGTIKNQPITHHSCDSGQYYHRIYTLQCEILLFLCMRRINLGISLGSVGVKPLTQLYRHGNCVKARMGQTQSSMHLTSYSKGQSLICRLLKRLRPGSSVLIGKKCA